MTDQNKYLLVYRIPCTEEPKVPPSPEEMQAMFARWDAWKTQFKRNIVDVGDGLKRTGKSLHGGVVTDGPYIESREIVGGYSVLRASSYEEALTVARACPIASVPGGRIEVRELAGY
jgi:hypothetical protein